MKTAIIFFVILSVITISCHGFIKRYKKNGPDMLTDKWIFHAPENTTAEVKENTLYLFSLDHNKGVNIKQGIPFFTHGSILKLSADMKCENIEPGKKSWNRARFLLIQHDGKRSRWDMPHQVASLTGTREWKRYSQSFFIGPKTETIQMTAQLSRCTGSFQLKNIHLYTVKQTELYNWIKKIILILWSFFAIFLLGSLFFQDTKKIVLQIMLLLAFAAIIIGTTMPADMKAHVTKEVEDQVHKVHDLHNNIHKTSGNKSKKALSWDISKVGHFLFFAIFGLVLSILLRHKPTILPMLHIVLLAGGTEIVQFYIDGRSPMFLDFIIDSAGGLSSIILMGLFLNMKKLEPLPHEKLPIA